MRSTTVTIALGTLAAVLAGPAAAQDGGSRLSLHHDERIPDYLTTIQLSAIATIRVPPPPDEGPRFGPLYHSDQAPNYLAAVLPALPPAIDIPAPPPGGPPAVVRGLYLNAWVFGSSRFYDLVALADTTEINTFVIDVKDATGHLTYRSSVPTAMQIGANRMVRAPDARRRIALLEAHGIHPIARIVVARDPLLAKRKPGWAIRHAKGGLWHDGLGEPWVDAYHDSVWTYAADVAAEAVVLGFKEIQFDYVRFPDEPPHRLAGAVYEARRPGESQRTAIRRQVALLKKRIASLGVPFTLDVFGLTTSADDGMGIGQYWDDLVGLADVLLPMVYPSHYPRGAFGIAYPNAEPYAVVRRALEDGLRRSRWVSNAARIRPYLQAFTLRRPRYTAAEVRAQIQAVEDVGLTDWVLWNARGVYPAAALRPSTGALGPGLPVASPNENSR
ncbi:MAG: GTP-binding protein [Gemmatimonadales bacterium]|nr:GTP-binding protein [Gemmatimonadales bacterium]NIN10376.1 GTP-binding protein [Gemmatimonadales bacterium]NIN49168.1 GTP-binding protein [Gemmatimonadales bacterium]NIP06632.1 GTP-binding protein [Gemmatimonadales bacterium]NIQ99962.1 GTP-binding protein [Gemmatimonadales bacterium]